MAQFAGFGPSEPFRLALIHLTQGSLEQAAIAFCRASGIESDKLDSDLPSDQREEVLLRLQALLAQPDHGSLSWWVDLADAWREARISPAARACAAHARRLATSVASAAWADLCKLAEISSVEDSDVLVKGDQAAPTPALRPPESYRTKHARLWGNFEIDWAAESRDGDPLIELEAVDLILRVRDSDSVTLSWWVQFWNYHSEPEVAIDHFFAVTVGTDITETLMEHDHSFMALLHLAESFQQIGDSATAYAALILVSTALASRADRSTNTQKRKEWEALVQEKLQEFESPPAELYSPRKMGTNLGIGFRMADWFVARKISGRFLEFLGAETLSNLARRYPLLRGRIEAMARTAGWANDFSPDAYLAGIVNQTPGTLLASLPLPVEPALVLKNLAAKRPDRERATAGRPPQAARTHRDPDRSVSLEIGFRRAASVSAMQVNFGPYNPLAMIHSRARHALPNLVDQLIRCGRSVVWIRDQKTDPSPVTIGIERWAWTYPTNSGQANLLPSTDWPAPLHEGIGELLSSSVHRVFRDDIRACLDDLLIWLAASPLGLAESAKRQRFRQCVAAVSEIGVTLDGPNSLRRMAILIDSLMSCLDDLRRAASVETKHYGRSAPAMKLAVFDTESEGLLNSVSLLLYVGGILGVMRHRHEMDFELNPRPRKAREQSDSDKAAPEALEEQRAHLNKLMTAQERTDDPTTLPKLDGKVSDLCIVISTPAIAAIPFLLDWIGPGAIGATASLVTVLDSFPQTPRFLGGFQTFVLGHLTDQERLLLRTSTGVSLPSMVSLSPADVLSVWKEDGGLSTASGLLWPPSERRI